MVSAKYLPKVKLENFHNSKVPKLEKLCVPWYCESFGVFIVAWG